MKLISMTDFVIKTSQEMELQKRARAQFDYAYFLKQPLTLGMFVPCDEEGKVLEMPIMDNYTMEEFEQEDGSNKFGLDVTKYQKAKDRVLFDCSVQNVDPLIP